MDKQLVKKKEFAKKNNNALSIFNYQKSYSLKDPRPLRDPDFMKAAKQEILKFMKMTDYPGKFDICIFNKITKTEVISMFEHFMETIVPGFRLYESQISPEERILNFYSTFEYKNNFTRTHITSPAIFSSIPFVIGAFDFLRRFVSACLYTNPSFHFPRLKNLNISSEIVFDALIDIHKKLESGDCIENELIGFKNKIRKAIDIKPNEEISLMANRLNKIEEQVKIIERLKKDIKSITIQKEELVESIEIEDIKYEKEKKLNEKLHLEILEEEKNLECVSNEKAFLEAEKLKYEEMGYGDMINKIEYYQQKEATIREQYQQTKLENEKLKQASRSTEFEFDNIKLQSQKQFADVIEIFPHLVDADILQVVNDLKPEHLINYDTLLRPNISNLISAIEAEGQLKQEELRDHIKHHEDLQKQSEFLNEENKLLEMENLQYINCIKQNENILQEYKQKSTDNYKRIQDLVNQINEQRILLQNAEDEAEVAKKKMEETKTLYEEASKFYEADIEFRKESSEIRVQTLQDSWQMRRSIVKMNEDFLKEHSEATALQKKEIEELAAKVMKMIEEESDENMDG